MKTPFFLTSCRQLLSTCWKKGENWLVRKEICPTVSQDLLLFQFVCSQSFVVYKKCKKCLSNSSFHKTSLFYNINTSTYKFSAALISSNRWQRWDTVALMFCRVLWAVLPGNLVIFKALKVTRECTEKTLTHGGINRSWKHRLDLRSLSFGAVSFIAVNNLSCCLEPFPFRLQLSQRSGLRGLCAFLRGNSGPLLNLHGRGRAGRRVLLFTHLTQPLFFFLPLLILILSAWGLLQSSHIQELEEVPGSVPGDPDVYGLHPGEGAAQAGPQG